MDNDDNKNNYYYAPSTVALHTIHILFLLFSFLELLRNRIKICFILFFDPFELTTRLTSPCPCIQNENKYRWIGRQFISPKVKSRKRHSTSFHPHVTNNEHGSIQIDGLRDRDGSNILYLINEHLNRVWIMRNYCGHRAHSLSLLFQWIQSKNSYTNVVGLFVTDRVHLVSFL